METLERTHVVTDPAILYFGTPVVLLSTVNPDGSPNLAPISSVFWLGRQAVLGINRNSQSWANLDRTREVAVALPSVDQVDAVNRLALTTGRNPVQLLVHGGQPGRDQAAIGQAVEVLEAHDQWPP